jgi:predicted transcriptional regulator
MQTKQSLLAAQCGVGQPFISRILRGHFSTSFRRGLDVVKAIEEAGGPSRLELLYPDEFGPAVEGE